MSLGLFVALVACFLLLRWFLFVKSRAAKMQPDRAVLRALLEEATGSTARDYTTFDFGRSRDPRGISVVVPKDSALELVKQLRPRAPKGWLVFAGTERWLGAEDHPDKVELDIGPGDDQLDILRLARSDAANYDLDTEALIAELRVYDSTVGLTILQANTDTVVAQIKKLPSDLTTFAEKVYAFCPDIVDEDADSPIEVLQAQLAATKILHLWWD